MPDRITIDFWYYLVLLFFLVPGMIFWMEAITKKWKRHKEKRHEGT